MTTSEELNTQISKPLSWPKKKEKQMTIEEFKQIRIGDKLIWEGKVCIVKDTTKYNYYYPSDSCFDVYCIHETKEELEEFSFCSDASREYIPELRKI